MDDIEFRREQVERGLGIACRAVELPLPQVVVWKPTRLQGVMADTELHRLRTTHVRDARDQYEAAMDRLWSRVSRSLMEFEGPEVFEKICRSVIIDSPHQGLHARTRILELLPGFSRHGYGEWEGFAMMAHGVSWCWLRSKWAVFVDSPATRFP